MVGQELLTHREGKEPTQPGNLQFIMTAHRLHLRTKVEPLHPMLDADPACITAASLLSLVPDAGTLGGSCLWVLWPYCHLIPVFGGSTFAL